MVNFNESAIESAVSLRFFREFVASLSHKPDISTEEVVDSVIRPATKVTKGRYLEKVPDADVSKPTFFVCHRWGNSFHATAQTLFENLKDANDKATFLWLDIFAVSQHQPEATTQDLDNVEALVTVAAGGTLVVMDREGLLLGRSWCLYEIWATVNKRGCSMVHWLTLGFQFSELGSAFLTADVRNGSSSNAFDRTKLQDRVSGTDGLGLRDFNMKLRLMFTLDPLDYTHSMEMNLAAWRMNTLLNKQTLKSFEKYIDWIHLPPSHTNYKSFAIYGPPGTNKTTIAEILCCSAGTNHGELKPHAWHFVKQHDRSRVDPIRMMRTFAYQLAVSIPDIQPYIRNIEPSKVFKLTQVDQAFHMLLRAPLARLARDGKTPPFGVVVLIDGLDEADWRGTYENPLLMVIREFFPALPNFFRFVVTSKGEAYCPHIVRSLRYKFCPMETVPRDILHREDVNQFLELRLGNVLDSAGSVPLVAELLMKKGGCSTVYCMAALSIMKEKNASEGKNWSLEDVRALPDELDTCFRSLLLSSLKSLQSDQDKTDLLHLLEVLLAAREPLSLLIIDKLGLKHLLHSLPGWGWMFVEQDYKVSISHTNVLAWLTHLDPELAHTYPPSPAPAVSTPSAAGERPDSRSKAGSKEDVQAHVAQKLGVPTQAIGVGDVIELSGCAGHRSLGKALMQSAVQDACPSDYSLRHIVAHLCLAGNVDKLEGLVQEFDFWERVYARGYGPDVFKDLLEMAPTGSIIATDIIRWLRGVSETLVKQPRAALQLGSDAPRRSTTSLAARRYKKKPDASLVHRDENWSPCLMIISDMAGGGRVTSVCFSPDGTKIANGSTSKTVRLWDANTGQQTALLEGPSSVFNSVCFSSDGSKLASGSDDKTVRVWDAKSGETLSVLEGHKDVVTAVAMSPDMSRLASASSDKSIRLWDMKIMEEVAVLEGHRDTVNSVSFTMDGSKVASGSADRTVRMWDVKQVKQLTLMEGHFGVIYTVACSPYSSQLASCSADKSIRIWEPEGGSHITTLEGHQASVTSISYSADGAYLASCSADKSIRVWDAKLFQQLMVIERQVGNFSSISFSPDGAILASGSSDKTLRLWDAKSGEEVAVLDGHLEGINCVMLSPDGVWCASSSADKTVRLWDIKADRQVAVLKGHSGVFSSVAFSPDGQLLASGSDDRTVRVWDSKTGQQVAVAEGHIEPVTSVAFSPDGTRVASASEDKSVKLWDSMTGAQITTANPIVHETGIIKAVAYSPDGSKLATGSADMQKTVRLWDAQSGKQLAVCKGHFAPVTGVAFSPEGNLLASGAQDRTVRIWDAENGQQICVLEGHTDAVTSIAFCPTLMRVASVSSDKTVRIWDNAASSTKAWKCVAVLRGHVKDIGCVAFHPDGSRVCSSGSETVRMWACPTHSSKRQLRASLHVRASEERDVEDVDAEVMEIDRHSGVITCIAFAPDGSQIATSSYDKTVILWSSATGKSIATLKGHSGVVNIVTFSPNSTKLASAGADETVRLWEAGTGILLYELLGHGNWVRTLSFSPSGTRLVSGSDDGSLRMWDVKSGREVAVLEGHTNWVSSIVWSEDGSKLLSGSEDRSARLWDPKLCKVLATLEGHADALTCVALSPNGQLAATGSEDRTVRVWSTYTFKLLAELKGHYGMLLKVRFSPDNKRIGSCCADKVLRLWDAHSFEQVITFPECIDGSWVGDKLVTLNTESGVISILDAATLSPLADIFSTYRLADMACSPTAIACRVSGWETVCVFRLNEENLKEKLLMASSLTSHTPNALPSPTAKKLQNATTRSGRGSRSPSPRRRVTSPRRMTGKSPSPTRRVTGGR